MSFRGLLAFVTASTVVACTLFSGLDGFTDTTPDSEAGATDAPAGDGGTNDAPHPQDDGSTNDGASAAGFCATMTGAALCADFDGLDPLAGWTQTTNPGAAFEIARDAGRSAPNAIRATVVNSNADRASFITRTLKDSVSHARLSYSLFVEERPADLEIETNMLRLNGCPNGCTSEFFVSIGNGESQFAEQAWDAGEPIANYHTLGDAIPTGKWVRIGFEIDILGTKEMVLTVDGVEIARKSLTIVAPGAPSIQAGISYANKSTPNGVILVDDVVLEVLP